MRNASKRRLEFESLETLTLLSNVVQVVHPHRGAAGAPEVAPASKLSSLALQGTTSGQSLLQAKGGGTTAQVSGVGPLRPFGRITLTGTINYDADGNQVSGALIVVTAHGKLLVSLQQSGPASNQYRYSIDGGTKGDLYARGTGNVTVQTNSGLPLPQGPGHDRVKLTFD